MEPPPPPPSTFLSNGRGKSTTSKLPTSIQLEDITHFDRGRHNNNLSLGENHFFAEDASEEEDSGSDLDLSNTRKSGPSSRHKIPRFGSKSTKRGGGGGGHSSSASASKRIYTYSQSDDNLTELPPLTAFQPTLVDVLFNGIVTLVGVLQLVLDLTLVVWHGESGHSWASALTCLFMLIGGISLLNQFWMVPRDQLNRIYSHGNAVRVWVNCFPPLATIITSFQTTSACLRSRSNPICTHQFVKLDELSRRLLRVQGFGQAAPQAALQLVVLLEDLSEIGVGKCVVTVLCIVNSLTTMTVANLPGKTEFPPGEEVSRAAYNPRARLYIGLRMISSFASRTMSLSLLFSSFRCIFPKLVQEAESDALPPTFLHHMIPLGILLVPRLLFSIIDCISSRISRRRRIHVQQSNFTDGELGLSTIPRKVHCLDTLLGYIATVFFPFGEPRWIFWYICVETVIFIVFGNCVAWLVPGDGAESLYCLGVLTNSVYCAVFAALFFIVPCVVPYVKRSVDHGRRERRRRNITFAGDAGGNGVQGGNQNNVISPETQ